MRPDCHLLGFGDDDTSFILCHFRKWPIASLPWNWVREPWSKEAFVSGKKAVSAWSRGFMNLRPGTLGVGRTSGHKMLSGRLVNEEVWSKEVTAGSVGLRRVAGAVKVNKVPS